MIGFFKRSGSWLLLFIVVILAFWQLAFLQNGMKWDFVDAFLPSRYFFSESILNNQFPFWNPYLLYGTPIYADLVSVFNPEFWIIANMFGYSNISLQFVFLAYVFVAGVSFNYFLKRYNTEYRLSIGLSIAYMLSGLSIGNAQHLAFVCGYALLPFVIACYFKFLDHPNKPNLFRVAIALFLMIYASYPGLTIILGYFLLGIFIYHIVVSWANKRRLKTLLIHHLLLLIIVVLSSSVLIVAYFQAAPFLSRYGGISMELALRHSFTVKSFLSFILPMATGNDPHFFETDTSMSNAYWGIISLALFLFSITQKAKNKESYLVLSLGIFFLLSAMGDQFILRELLYKYAPLMDMFKYPSIFRAFAIFGFLAFLGSNFELSNLNKVNRKLMISIAGFIIVVILMVVWQAKLHISQFAFFNAEKSFAEEVLNSTKFDNIIFQGTFQVLLLLVFVFVIWKIKDLSRLASALLFLFVIDGIVATQLNIHYTVVSEVNPIRFYNYLKSSPKGFPIPELNPMSENSDKNAENEFIWMNNNVFPKKVSFDGLVSFKLDGYAFLADNYPDFLEEIKKKPVVYLSDDLRENSLLEDYKLNTIFLSTSDFKKLEGRSLQSDGNDKLQIRNFSPSEIEIQTTTSSAQLLAYQQNYYAGWRVFIDGKEQNLLTGNFAHMAVFLPSGEHTVVFKYSNPIIKYSFYFTILIFVVLVAWWLYYYTIQNPEKKRKLILVLLSCAILFGVTSVVNRYLYKKNKLGLAPHISTKIENWRTEYGNEIDIFLSTQQKDMTNSEYADTVCYVDEKTNLSELSYFLVNNNDKYFAFAWQGCIISADIFELIYSFYPKIIEIKRNNNSGIVLLGKNDEKDNYSFYEDFESEASCGWSKEKHRVISDSLINNHSYSYSTNEEWGTTLKIIIGEELAATEKITIIGDLMIDGENVEIPLVFTIEREGKTHLYEATLINKFVKFPGQWTRGVFVPNLTTKLLEGDVITVYFWNKGKGQFRVDNLKIRFSPSK